MASDRSTSSSSGPESPPTSGADDPSRDALADVLRSFGEQAFDVDELSAAEIREAFDAWARHALVGAPRPNIDRPDSPAGEARDWRGIARFAADHRRQESAYVVRGMRDLRDVIWAFVQGVARAVSEDAAADGEVSQQLGRLHESLERNDTGAVKRDALASISLVEDVMTRRKERQQRLMVNLSSRIKNIRDELSRAREQLERDDLTGLYGRGALDEYLERVVDLGTVSGQTATLYMIDCDDFKWVNDSFGHTAGDDVLKALAGILSSNFRRASDFVARYGGDEFAVVVPNGKVDEIHDLGEALLHAVRDLAVPKGDQTIRVGVSVGAARLIPGEETRQWVERADRALYDAKEAGRDRLVVADVTVPPLATR